jgi:Pentapeptide repeats (9 copies)
MSEQQAPPEPPEPDWPTCKEVDGCIGIAVGGHDKCLAHVDTQVRRDYLAGLWPGAPVDLRGTQLSAALLDAIVAATGTGNDPAVLAVLGDAKFQQAEFSGEARLDGVRFSGDASFDWAQFLGFAGFAGAQFCGNAGFSDAQFSKGAQFDGARFSETAMFRRARFSESIWFYLAEFSGDALAVSILSMHPTVHGAP